MLEFVICHSSSASAEEAAEELAACIRNREDAPPHALLLFASPRYDHRALLLGLQDRVGGKTVVGCTSAGEFTNVELGEGMAVAVALWSDEIEFRAVLARNIMGDCEGAAKDFATQLTGVRRTEMHKTAIVFVDALAGFTEQFVNTVTTETAGEYQFVGGGAGDDARFQETRVFSGTSVVSNAAVGLEMLSRKPIGIGVRHGWITDSNPLRVTASEGNRLKSLNGLPAIEVYESHATGHGQTIDRSQPMPYFLHHVLGVKTPSGIKLRVPLAVLEDGSIEYAADIPTGAIVHIMRAGEDSSAEAAAAAVTAARTGLLIHKPKLALFFDCVATRLRLGERFSDELESVARTIPSIPFAGFNTHGQVARADGQFSGFHNCTAVVCLFPE